MDIQHLTDTELDAALTEALRGLDLDRFEQLATLADQRHAAREARLARPAALAEAALWYARQGWPVFPLQPRGKKPYPGSRGLHDATTDTDQVGIWWTDRPASNIGLATGHVFDVIDVDGPPGFASLADLREDGMIPPVLGKVWTPAGGRHLFVAPTGDGNAAGLRPGVDYRGLGGYVVAPPSVHPNGGRYEWMQPFTPVPVAA